MRWVFVLLAACGAEPRTPAPPPAPLVIEEPEPVVTLALVPSDPGTLVERITTFTTGAGPMTFAASAPRGVQLVVWASLYRDQALVSTFDPHRVYRFDRAGTVPITLRFDWTPKPGNLQHRYELDVAGEASAAVVTNPHRPVGSVHAPASADPAAFDTDYVLFFAASDAHEAWGFDTVEKAVAKHDQVIVIRARFVAPRELPIAWGPPAPR